MYWLELLVVYLWSITMTCSLRVCVCVYLDNKAGIGVWYFKRGGGSNLFNKETEQSCLWSSVLWED